MNILRNAAIVVLGFLVIAPLLPVVGLIWLCYLLEGKETDTVESDMSEFHAKTRKKVQRIVQHPIDSGLIAVS